MKKTILIGLIFSLVLKVEQSKADFTFGEPTKVPNINSSSNDFAPSITADGLMLYFSSNRDHSDDGCYTDIWVTTRGTKDEPWETPTKIGPPINTSGPEGNSCISADGLELYFGELWPPLFLPYGCQPRPEGYGYGDIWVSSRETIEDPWGEPVNLGPAVNSSGYEDTPNISADGLTLYFSSDRRPETALSGSGLDIYVTTRLSRDDPWSPAVEIGPAINTATVFVSYPFISSDDLSLIFMGAPLDYTAKGDIYLSRRATTSDPWGKPVRLLSINTSRNEESVTFAAGDSTLYFSRGDPYNPNQIPDPALTTYDIWQVEVTPVVDLNIDGIVDSADICILVDNWYTKNTLCDIAPAPLGDGYVDVQDLIVLAEHLFEEFPPAEPAE